MTVISASIMPLAALFFTPLPARSSLCALEALRWVVGGETMTTPGGTRTPCQSVPATPPCSAHRLLSWVGAPSYRTPALRFAPARCPKPSPHRSVCVVPCVGVHQHVIPDDMSVPSPAVLAPSGWGYVC